MPGGHWVCFWMRCGSTKLEVVKGGDTLKIEYPQSMIELYWNIKKIMKGKKKHSHGGNISNLCFHFMELFPVLGHTFPWELELKQVTIPLSEIAQILML